jgi:hypothetical protein
MHPARSILLAANLLLLGLPPTSAAENSPPHSPYEVTVMRSTLHVEAR